MPIIVTYSNNKDEGDMLNEDKKDFDFFTCDIEIKRQDKIVKYFEEEVNIPVGIRRERGLAILYTSKQSLEKALEYTFNNYESIVNKFNLSETVLDLSTLRKTTRV